MKKSQPGLTKNIASSRNWFRAKLLPDGVELRRQMIRDTTEVQCYDGIKLVFVEHGSGRMIVNGRSYSIRAGNCCLLYCFHFHKLIPAPGDPLHISVCHISYNTFLFATIVPGHHLIKIEQSQDPILVDFSQVEQQRIHQILSAMEEHSPDPGGDMKHALLFEWLGRLCRGFAETAI